MNDDCSINIDRGQSGETLGDNPDFTQSKAAPTDFDCEREQEVKIEVIIDHNSVEAFFFDWYSFTSLVFTDANNNGIEIWASMSEDYIRVKYLKLEIL